MKKILILMLVITASLCSAGTFRVNTKPQVTPASLDELYLEDQSDSWQAKALTISDLRDFIFSDDITTLGIDWTVNFGTFAATYAELSGGTINNMTIGSTTPSSGTFTSVSISSDMYCQGTLTPAGTGTPKVGTSSLRWDEGWFDSINTTEATIGDVSDTEIQLLDDCENALIYQGGGNVNRSIVGSTTLEQKDEGGHLLNSSSTFNVTMPSLADLPIMWGCMFHNIGSASVTILDNAADGGFSFTGDTSTISGTSITVGADDTIYLMSIGGKGKWLIVSHYGCSIN